MTIGFVKDGNLHYLKYSKHKNFSYSIHSSVLESDFKCRVFCILLNLHCFLFSVFCFLLSVSLFLFFFFLVQLFVVRYFLVLHPVQQISDSPVNTSQRQTNHLRKWRRKSLVFAHKKTIIHLDFEEIYIASGLKFKWKINILEPNISISGLALIDPFATQGLKCTGLIMSEFYFYISTDDIKI